MTTHFVDVLFAVPEYISNGLGSGEMIRRGGVIQWGTGAGKGEVVTWLKEVGELTRGTDAVSAPVMGQLRNLQMTTSALAVGQALTLGFSVLSFAILNRKLNVLGQKVERVLANIATLKQEVDWLDRRQDIALAARLRGALDQGNWADRSGRIEALVTVRGILVEVEQHYTGLLEGMLDAQRAHQHAELFATYDDYLALAAVAKARCEVMLDGPGAGASSIRAARTVINAIDIAFREPLRQVDAHLHLLRLGTDAERWLRPALEAMKETAHRVEGYQTEMEYCARERILLSDWEQLGCSEADGCLVLLVPKSDRERG